ncbi:MAG TPA: hypothetical protein VF763_06640 [Candidatus Limnocylindrales bacterium]
MPLRLRPEPAGPTILTPTGLVARVAPHVARRRSAAGLATDLGLVLASGSILYACTSVLVGTGIPLGLLVVGLVAGLALIALPVGAARSIPSWLLSAAVIAAQTCWALGTGGARSPYLAGFLAIVVVVAATSSTWLSLLVAGLASWAVFGLAVADARLSPDEVVTLLVFTTVMVSTASLVARLGAPRQAR